MIAWLQPSALWGLVLVAAPVLIHLLRTRRAPTVAFPSIRFVRASQVAAIRVGAPSDLALLLVRAGIVALSVLALAQPLVLTRLRLAHWNGRVARAIVIDRSDSMSSRGSSGRTAAEDAADVAAAEAGTAAAAIRIEASDLGAGVRRAARWLEAAPPARREVLVLSDFQLGTLGESVIQSLPPGVGLRLIEVGGTESVERRIAGMRLLAAPEIDERRQDLRISRDGTEATLSAAAGATQPGLRILAAAGEQRALIRAVARAGAPAPPAGRPIVLRFANAPAAGQVAAMRDRWMIDTIAALEADNEIARAARDVAAVKVSPSGEWTILLRDGGGNALVRAAALGPELMLDAAVQPSSYFAALLLQRALEASHGPAGSPEQEVLHIQPERLAAWNRTPAPVDADVWRLADSSDARWCWVAVLALLGLEQWIRRKRPEHQEEHRAAA